MPNIKIDNIDYDLDTLSDEAKAQLGSLQFVDAELARLNAKAAVLQTARMAYSKALNEVLPSVAKEGAATAPKKAGDFPLELKGRISRLADLASRFKAS